MIQCHNLTKKYDKTTVVNQLDLTFQSGVVTGFLGPNGSGKSTTMKMMISLVHPTSGSVTIDQQTYCSLAEPAQKIGTMIDPSALNTHLTARQHLSLLSTAADLDHNRIGEVLKTTGLEHVQHKKIKSFSLGMKQRLGIAAALIGNPDAVILDEPFNGMDVDGLKWLRRLFKQLAGEGKTVIVSSHLMSEMQAVADRIIIIAQGKLLSDMTIEEMNQRSMSSYVYVKANPIEKMAEVLHTTQADVSPIENGLAVRNLDAREIGQLAYDHHIVIYELKDVQPTLEELFAERTAGKVDYVSQESPGEENT
ncbi:ATP-binding cassette domain-containing protein [Salibacterium aidingense]|uniref:ATP-binding cassette domain-containing protein n=1 Tax=Salibacterium aidingense TaxID=384933 RepID=UPI003BE884DC